MCVQLGPTEKDLELIIMNEFGLELTRLYTAMGETSINILRIFI